MLARPVSSAVAELLSWRAIFAVSAVLMAGLFIAGPPVSRPAPGLTYGALLASMGRIFFSTSILRRRAFYHAFLFGAFSVFWTAVPLWLGGPQFGLTQSAIVKARRHAFVFNLCVPYTCRFFRLLEPAPFVVAHGSPQRAAPGGLPLPSTPRPR